MQIADTPTPPAEPSQASNRSALMIVFLVVFIDLLGFGIILPLLPRIAEGYVSRILPSATWEIGLIVGLLMSSFSLMQFVFAPIWGRLSDRIGRRPILQLGLLSSAVFYGLFGYAASLPVAEATLALVLFFVARIGAGIAGATIAAAQAVIADSTAPEKRKHGMALIGVAFGIGFTFGPLIGFGCLWISPTNLGLIGYTAAGLSALAWLLGLALLPETRVFNEDPTGRRHLLDPSAIRQALGDRAIGPVILTFFIASLGFGAFEVTLALFLKDTFNLGENGSFLMFAYVGFVLMLTQGVLYRRLASRVSEPTFIAMGIFFMLVGVTMQGAINYTGAVHLAYLFIALTAAVVGFAFLTPSAHALISRRTSADRQGEILGVNQSASAMARILGPVFGVTLYKAEDSHVLPYIGGAILLLLLFLMLPKIRRGGDVGA
ncbi:MAG: MFS transporter [Gemmataceae bacterium]|nr:MFS transporter [Gemmataceae bacterium]